MDTFGKVQRTPPNSRDDSSIVNPNATSCQLCQQPDTTEMVQCDDCEGWHHFQCVGVTYDQIANVPWKCPACDRKEKETSQRAKSVRSSTSSKRRGNLLLEKLAKEKAIAEKYAEDQQKILEEKERNLREQTETARKLVQAEFDIRDAMSDSDDDRVDLTGNGEPQDKNDLVVDWLNNPRMLEQKIDQLVAPAFNLPAAVLLRAVGHGQANPDPTQINQNDGNLGSAPNASFDQNVVRQSSINQNMIQLSRPSSPQQSLNPNNLALIPMSSTQTVSSQSNHNLVQQQMSSQIQLPLSGQTLANRTFQHPVTTVPNSQPITQKRPSNGGVQSQSTTGQILQSVVTSSGHQPLVSHTYQPLVSYSNQPLVSHTYQPLVSHTYQPLVSHTYQPLVSHTYQPLASYSNQPLIGQVTQPITQSSTHQLFTSQTHQSFTGQIPHPTIQPSQYTATNQSQQPTGHVPSYQQTVPVWQNPHYHQQITPISSQIIANGQFRLSREQIAARQAMSKELPKFKGEPEKWSIFYNAYITSTSTCGLSNGENLDRLQKCLGDPARKLVRNLLTQPEAVPDIIETLRMRYGRPEVIIESLLKQLRDDSSPIMDKMDSFIDFAMSVRNASSEIQKLGMWQYLHNPSLIQELIERLPYDMRISWGEQKLSNPNADLSHFSDWLYIRARSACAVTFPQPARDDKQSEKKSSNNSASFNAHLNSNEANKSKPPYTQSSSTNSKPKQNNSCQFCGNQTHHHRDCSKFLKMDYNARWEAVKEKKLCHRCLGNHHSLSCKDKNLCGEPGCPAKHHRLLHDPNKMGTAANENSSNKVLHTAHQTNKIVFLRRYIPVTLYGPNGSLDVLAFFDDGSDFTLVEEEVVETLGIDGTPEDLYLEWTSKIVRKERGSKTLSLEISGHRLSKRYSMQQVRTVKRLDLPSQTVDVDHLKSQYKFLRRIPLVGYKNESPKIIIGLMDCKLSTSLKNRSGSWEEPIATKTLLGWEIHGSKSESLKVASLNFHFNSDNADENLHQMVADFFSLENFGVKKPEKTLEATVDKRAKELLESTTKRIGDGTKFETGMLWKYDKIFLPDSLPMATRRLESLCRRLERDPDLDMKFRSKMAEYIQKGYVRKLTNDEEMEKSPKIWYLPLFPVINPKKPGKIRLVWDAAAVVGETSLNSVLLKGPDQLVSLPGVLLRFREGPFGITGDIREMFHRTEIRKEDQMAQRFLWKEKGSNEIEKYVLLVMSFGAACSPSSAQYIKNRNADEFSNEYPRAEIAIRQNHYVDDWLQSFQSEKELLEVAEEVKFVHSKANFDITNWISNSSMAMSKLDGNHQLTEQKISFDFDDNHTERVLGMWWNVSRDTFTYSLRYHPLNKDVLTGVRRPTKREILRTLMAVYDPLGFLACFFGPIENATTRHMAKWYRLG